MHLIVLKYTLYDAIVFPVVLDIIDDYFVFEYSYQTSLYSEYICMINACALIVGALLSIIARLHTPGPHGNSGGHANKEV